MCGLAGWFGKLSREQKPVLKKMADAIAHRGPDGEGFWWNKTAGLAHRRLSIIDIAGGAQPMRSHDGRYVIAFNGEVYNYKQLRAWLEHGGHQFRTRSDTEVVIELYRALGTRGFDRLRGMYAFAIWDCSASRGVLARDLYGIKPLFLAVSRGCVLFASEAKAIVAATGSAQLNPTSLHLLLNFRYLPGTSSMFRGIEQLAPGEIIEWKNDKLMRRSISPPQPSNDPVRTLLDNAVERHLIADVEVGGYLSGGVDSAAICALAASRSSRQFRSFTLPIGDDPSEADNAAETARLLSIVNIRGETPPSSQMDLRRLTWHLEIPKVNSWQVYELARHARSYVKVVLSGLGADELFYGYNAHAILALLDRIATPVSWPTRIAGAVLATGASALPLLWNEPFRLGLMARSVGDWPRVYGLLRNVWDCADLRRRIYGPRMLDEQLPDAFDMLRRLWPGHRDPLTAAAQFEWRHKMVNDLLWQEDRASMAVGLEVRVPYLDADFAETVQRIPRTALMRNNRKKAYFKDLIADVVP
jgi:asparagine synthase (glutamine-hydrolysing)